MIGAMDTRKPPTTRRTPTDAEIPGLLAELRSSRESIAGFARSRGLTAWKLYRAGREPKPTKLSEPAAPIFEPIRVLDLATAPSAIELEHRGGHLLRIPAGFDADTLRRLLGVLESC